LPPSLGRYEIGAKLADGGMATIYLGRRTVDRQLVAIKRIREDYAKSDDFLRMFLDEATLSARLRHPRIVRSFELVREGRAAFIAMELLRGQSLWSVWDACRMRGIRLRCEIIAWIGARVAEGLHYAHELADERGRPLEVVHRDVNATNIFVTYDGDVKILDFGLAKASNRASRTAAGIIKGKVAYMSPEQAIGAPIDRRTDLFALGTTLWELACDRRLFKHVDEIETLRRVHAAEVPDPGTLVRGFPQELSRVILKALERDRDRRYATGAALSCDLDAFVGRRAGQRELGTMMRELFSADAERMESGTIAVAEAPPHPPTIGREPPKIVGKARSADASPKADDVAPPRDESAARPEGVRPSHDESAARPEGVRAPQDPSAENPEEIRLPYDRTATFLAILVALALACLVALFANATSHM
jgi:serine/threonine-protein kinase